MGQEARTFSVMFSRNFPAVATGALPEQISGRALSPNTFSLLGVAPAAGRFFTASDVPVPASPPAVAGLGYGLWQRRFSGDPAISGKNIGLNPPPYTILGVMARRFPWENGAIV